MELVIKKIADLKLDPSNPNVMGNEELNRLKYSMEVFDYVVPIIIDSDNMIFDGHHRLEILKAQGKTEIEVLKLPSDLSDSKKKLLRQALKKIHGEHDKEKDILEYKRIIEGGFERELFAMIDEDERALKEVLSEVQEERLGDEEEIPEDIEPKVKEGDLWKLGNHYLLCGDSTISEDVLKLFGDEQTDLILTDPPYGVDYANKNEFLNGMDKGNRIQTDIENDNIKDYEHFFSSWLSLAPLKQTNIFYIFISGKKLRELLNALHKTNYYFTQVLPWVKNNFVLSRLDYKPKTELCLYGWKGKHEFYGELNATDVLEFKKPHKSDLHPTMKPIELLCKLLEDGSKMGMNVYDPFGGSGSTLIACEKLKRNCFTIEISPHYCDVIIERWEKYTGQKAVKIENA